MGAATLLLGERCGVAFRLSCDVLLRHLFTCTEGGHVQAALLRQMSLPVGSRSRQPTLLLPPPARPLQRSTPRSASTCTTPARASSLTSSLW